MKYILDFDGVIFNTEALKRAMHDCGIAESSRSKDTFAELKKAFEAKGEVFDPLQFVYKDALSFIRAHKNECVIVSSFASINPDNNLGDGNQVRQKEYQEAKIAFSGMTELLGERHIHIVGLSKKDALAKLQIEYQKEGETFCFIDDRDVYINEAQSLGIPAFWMNRLATKRGTFGSVESFISREKHKHEIGSFDELHEAVKGYVDSIK